MILITGGTGFLGSHVMFKLFNLNKKVRVLKRKESSLCQAEAAYKFYKASGFNLPDFENYLNYFEWSEGDINEFDTLKECLNGITEIYHIAGFISYNAKDADKLRLVNTEGTRLLVNLALENGIKRFHYVSSIAALNRSEKTTTNESDTGFELEYHSGYSGSKYLAEIEAWRGFQEGLSGVIVNPGVIIGPGHPSAGSLQIFNMVLKGMKFYPSGSNGFVDVRDVASMLVMLSENEKYFGERYLLVSESVLYKDIFEMIAAGFGKKPPANKIGKKAAGLMAWLDGVKSDIFGTKQIITKEMASFSSKKFSFDNKKVRSTLGADFIPVKKSIEESCQFLNADYAGKYDKH